MIVMTWTVILHNDVGEVKYSVIHAPHGKKDAMDKARELLGSKESTVNGFYALAIAPGNHPIYSDMLKDVDG